MKTDSLVRVIWIPASWSDLGNILLMPDINRATEDQLTLLYQD